MYEWEGGQGRGLQLAEDEDSGPLGWAGGEGVRIEGGVQRA